MQLVLMGFAIILGLGLGVFVIWTSLKDKASKYAFGGAVHAFLGRYEEADRCYGKALEIDPDHFDALYFRGARHAAAREFPQAVSCYERCLRKRPGDPNCLFRLGAVFYDMNHVGRAVGLWKELIGETGNGDSPGGKGDSPNFSLREKKDSPHFPGPGLRNVEMVKGLLARIARGEKDVLADEEFLKTFRWHE